MFYPDELTWSHVGIFKDEDFFHLRINHKKEYEFVMGLNNPLLLEVLKKKARTALSVGTDELVGRIVDGKDLPSGITAIQIIAEEARELDKLIPKGIKQQLDTHNAEPFVYGVFTSNKSIRREFVVSHLKEGLSTYLINSPFMPSGWRIELYDGMVQRLINSMGKLALSVGGFHE